MTNSTSACPKKPHLSRLTIDLAHRHDNRIRERMEEIGISKAVGPLMAEIAHHEGITQKDLCEKMHFKASSISVSIQKMCDAGLVVRIPDSTDARREGLYLTEQGKENHRKIHSTFDELEAEFLMPLTEEERDTFRRLIEKLLSNREDTK